MGNFNSPSVGGADERAGGVQHGGDPADRRVGVRRMGAADGLVTCAAAWLLSGRQSVGALLSVEPKYMLAGGILGAFITYTVIRSMESLGPARAALLIVVSQILVAYGIELFGLFGVERAAFAWRKALGAAVAIAGIIIFRS